MAKGNAKMGKREASSFRYFETLYSAWGPQHWWPANSAFEVVLGAFLTQNTSWTNVEKALENLRAANALSLKGIRQIAIGELEALVRPAGYFRQKTARIKSFVGYLDSNYRGSLEALLNRPTHELRVELLLMSGVGPETADSILLYAGQHEIFVVDAYTRRIFERHGLVTPDVKYEEIRELVEAEFRTSSEAASTVPSNGAFIPPPKHAPSPMSQAKRSTLAQRFNDFHGLIVQVGKHYCLKQAPRCEGCPLQHFLPK